MAGIKGKPFSVAGGVADAGVKRISLATSLYRAAMTGLLNAARRREVKENGTLGYVDTSMPTCGAEWVHEVTAIDASHFHCPPITIGVVCRRLCERRPRSGLARRHVTHQRHATGQARSEHRHSQAIPGRQQLAPDTGAAFAVQYFARPQVTLGGRHDVPAESGRRAGRLAAQGRRQNRDVQLQTDEVKRAISAEKRPEASVTTPYSRKQARCNPGASKTTKTPSAGRSSPSWPSR